jgi:hypothetical protein
LSKTPGLRVSINDVQFLNDTSDVCWRSTHFAFLNLPQSAGAPLSCCVLLQNAGLPHKANARVACALLYWTAFGRNGTPVASFSRAHYKRKCIDVRTEHLTQSICKWHRRAFDRLSKQCKIGLELDEFAVTPASKSLRALGRPSGRATRSSKSIFCV